MKVIRVKAKVVSPKLYTQEDMDSMTAELASYRNQVMGLKQKVRDAEDQGMKVANDLATRLVKVMDEVDAARAEAAELNVELMERQTRIDELERRIEWLSAHSDTGADFVS